jgi:hypothetical protein
MAYAFIIPGPCLALRGETRVTVRLSLAFRGQLPHGGLPEARFGEATYAPSD